MRSYTHLGVACICTRIPITHPYFLPLLVAVLLHAHLPTNPPLPISYLRVYQGLSQVIFLSPLGGTMPFSFDPLIITLSPLSTPQIRDVLPPTVPQLPAVTLCKSDLTGILLPLVCLLPPESPMSHLLIYLLYFL